MRIPTQKIHNTLTLCLAFSLPLYRLISPLIIILLLLNWLIEGNWKEKASNYKTHKLALIPCLLYILYCLGMIYSENIEFGMKDLEMKLSLLILPLIFASKPPLSKEEINKIMNSFTIGCGLATIICFAHSIFLYYNEIQQVKNGMLHDTYTNVNFFFSNSLSYFTHPSYFAMYLNLCCAYILKTFFSNKRIFIFQNRLILSIILITFSITTFFLASKMGIIVLVLIYLAAISYTILKKKYYITGASIMLFMIVSIFFLYKKSVIFASKFSFAINTIESKKLDKTSPESNTVRILIWNQAINLIKTHPFLGVGTGDIKDVLLETYKAEGMTGAFNHKLNTHNQFFQTTITLGIFAGLLLFICLLTPLIDSIKNNNYILFIFIFLFTLNILVESMFEIQAGVLFYAFFNSVLPNSFPLDKNG